MAGALALGSGRPRPPECSHGPAAGAPRARRGARGSAPRILVAFAPLGAWPILAGGACAGGALATRGLALACGSLWREPSAAPRPPPLPGLRGAQVGWGGRRQRGRAPRFAEEAPEADRPFFSELQSLSREARDADRRALGLDVRTSSISAVIVEAEDGGLPSHPSCVPFDPPADLEPKAFAEALAKKLGEVTAPLRPWSGPVGCSITRRIAKALGCPGGEDSEQLADALDALLRRAGIEAGFVHVMVPTEAAGYAELAAAGGAGGGAGGGWEKLALVVTVGANWGGVLFNNGYRLRRSALDELVVPDWATLPTGEWLPSAQDADWPDYVRSADSYIADMVELARPDHVVLLPTGAAATRAERMTPDEFLPLLERTGAAAKSLGFTLTGSGHPEDAIVRGAALSALLELRVVRARLAIRRALEGSASVERLTPSQLLAVFDALDEDGSGGLSPDELAKGLDSLGLTLDAREIFAEELLDDVMTFDELRRWWDDKILNTPVLSLVSHEALQELVRKQDDEVPGGFGPLILAELTFSYCRACRKFAKKYEELALRFPDVRMVTLTVNHNKATVKWAASLKVRKAPFFLLYRRGTDISSPLVTWSGANSEKAAVYIEEMRQELTPKA